jgi:molecular chaperone GrpE (heat shock protein)
MKKEKAFLREKFVEFQLKAAELNHALTEQRHAFQSKEKELFNSLFEVTDAFENLEEILSEKEESSDKTVQMLSRNIRSIRKKLIRIFKASHVVPLEFPDKKACMEYCKVLETRRVPDMENETILSVVKTGYINTEQNAVLRKAEVITVSNGQGVDEES